MSYHVWGLAYDIGIFRLPPGQTDCAQANEYLEDDPAYRSAGSLGEAQCLEWGGRWTTIVDLPHYQLPLFLLSPDFVHIRDLDAEYLEYLQVADPIQPYEFANLYPL